MSRSRLTELLNSKAVSAVAVTVLGLVAGFGTRYVDDRVSRAVLDGRVTAIEEKQAAGAKTDLEFAKLLQDLTVSLKGIQVHQDDTDRRVTALEGRPSVRSN